MDTRLRNALHDLAQEMPIDVDAPSRRTLRRARTRRALSAAGVALAAVALVVLSVSVLRFADEPTVTPAITGPNPAGTFEGLWPETDAGALAETQAAVDEGHLPLRTTPEGTATLFAIDLLGWDGGEVIWEPAGPGDGVRGSYALLRIGNQSFGPTVPPIVVELRQLGETASNGVWSVVGASSHLIEFEVTNPGGRLRIAGTLSSLFDGAPAIEAHVFDGPMLVEPSLGFARYELTDRTFGFDVEVSPTPDGLATLLIAYPDATGASLGAALVAVETPVGESPPSGVDVTGVPPDVAVTAQRIYDAARAGDVDALGELLDPSTFVYNLDDGSDPTPIWREDPSELELMVAILELPPTSREIEGVGTFYFWPYLVNSDLDALTDQERADLARLGFSDEEIRLMIDGGAGYQGPRLAIDEHGVWRNFITVGE